jgi:hypothetical protein
MFSIIKLVIILPLLLASSIIILYKLTEGVFGRNLKFPPNTIDDIHYLLENIRSADPYRVFLIYTLTYLTKQTFAIPGSALMV